MSREEDSMAYDLLIKNGMVVDGTGASARQADVAITGGTIAEIGRVSGGAATVIDADGLVVAPGFIDPHTHYDAQICWDGATTPSSWHGVTSVVMGNCVVGIAPCRPQPREIAMRDLVNVEAIPFEVLNAGITWDWETFPQYMEAAARRKPALNLAFLAPLTPFRHYVMGEASMERGASAGETAKIKVLLGEALDAGAFGFSSTLLNQHLGYQGRPLACRNASREELKAYCNALRERGKGSIEFAMTRQVAVLEVRSDGLKRYEGRTVAEIAAERGVDGVDALLDVTLEDDLENEFTVQSWNTRADRMAELLNDRSVLLGLGDGGAHLDMLCDSGYPTYVLGTWVRERKVLSLEEAVRRMTSDPADFFGIRDRGRLKAGQAADIVIFDPATVGSGGRPERLHDLPGGAKRMVVRSRGIEMTLVNGEPTWEKGALTGASAGKVLRS